MYCCICGLIQIFPFTGQRRNVAAKTLSNIPDDIFQKGKISHRQVSANDGKPTSLISFSYALELIQVLPGRVAKDTRTQFADIIRRYLAGDHSLIEEIQTNAQSPSPITQMASDSLGIITDEDMIRKRRREQLEMRAAFLICSVFLRSNKKTF